MSAAIKFPQKKLKTVQYATAVKGIAQHRRLTLSHLNLYSERNRHNGDICTNIGSCCALPHNYMLVYTSLQV